MGKQWAKQQIKTNELQDFVDVSIAWIAANREKVLFGAVVAVVASSLVGFTLFRKVKLRDDAWDRLSIAQAYAFTGRVDDSMKQLAEIQKDYSSAQASTYATLFEGDILYRKGSYKEAATAYTKALERGGKNIEPLALANLGISQEAAGLYSEAKDTARRFLDTFPDHFMAPTVYASLARCLNSLNQPDEARAALQKITLQYPDTFWASWAQAKLQAK
ncbi:MAG: tetratricopeptide repeat protein [Elusimicrobia bacterium]|nr:tetratricopeptide repeat protein [Elusimicrobiota bacterium]